MKKGWKSKYKAALDVSIISITIPIWGSGGLEDDRFGLDEDEDQEVLTTAT